jgi:hypothetical protein
LLKCLYYSKQSTDSEKSYQNTNIFEVLEKNPEIYVEPQKKFLKNQSHLEQKDQRRKYHRLQKMCGIGINTDTLLNEI